MITYKKITNIVDKVKYLDVVWEILIHSYTSVSGGLLFKTKDDLLTSTKLWKIIIKKGNVIAVTVFKSKHGLKLVAMGIVNIKQKKDVLLALAKSIEEDLKHSWMEVSGKAEDFVMKHCNAYKYMIHNAYARELLSKEIYLRDDGYHYYREISNLKKEKIIVGTPFAHEIFEKI